MKKDEWIRRCIARFDACVRDPAEGWRDLAESCWETMYEDFKDDPEGAADSELAWWGNMRGISPDLSAG